LVNTAKPIQ